MRLFFYLFVGFSLFATNLFAVGIKDFDTRGNDFWLTFPPNIHNTNSDDALYIYIGAEKPTKGTISFGGIERQKFEIKDTSVLYSYKVKYTDFELGSEYNEKPSNRTFHIVTDSQVTVYALSKALQTSDAFLVLPTNVLGKEYYVMSYNSDNTDNIDFNGNVYNNKTPSQFAVIATQDGTTVTMVLPPNQITSTSRKSINTTLQKGESYLVQSSVNFSYDLTGTHILSNKPVAVVGSQQRASIPYTYTDAARNFLIEQMIPVNTWGYDAFLVPFPKPGTTTGNNNNDIYRILAARNNTHITINGNAMPILNAGEKYEGDLVNAASVSSDNPIMVALFKKSTEASAFGGGQSNISDPFMMLVPPADQFLKSYRWINSQAYTIDTTYSRPYFDQRKRKFVIDTTISVNTVFKEQYVIVVSPNTAINSIIIDNKRNTSTFTKIPNSNYSYSWISVSDGVHSIYATEGIGIYVFGYGPADAYGYIGGMNMVNTTSMTSTVKPLNITAAPGETVNLPLILDSIKGKPNIAAIGIDHYTATFRFNATLLTPLAESQRGKIENGFQIITVSGTYSGQSNGDTLASIPMVAGLGDAETSPIDILEFHWFGVAGDTITSSNGLKSAVFTLKDVFVHSTDGKRLINPQEGNISLSIEPNPTSTLPISIVYGGELMPNTTLIIYNTIGREVANLSSQLTSVPIGGSAPTYIKFTQPNLTQGVYFVRLASGEFSIVRPMIYE